MTALRSVTKPEIVAARRLRSESAIRRMAWRPNSFTRPPTPAHASTLAGLGKVKKTSIPTRKGDSYLPDRRSARRRALRLMREHGLLSPRRARQGKGIEHDGRITTDAPDLMWGTDGTRVQTAEEGMCW